MKSEETWKPIRGFPSYEISNLGRVRSKKRAYSSGGYLKLQQRKGQTFYNLYENSKVTRANPHHLMAENFPYEWIKHLEEGEEAKEIKGYPGYFITTQARVWNNWKQKFVEPFHLHTSSNKNPSPPYLMVTLGGKKAHKLHQLVAKHFIPNPEGYPFVLHKEDNINLNSVEHLEWGTASTNNQQAVANKKRKLKTYTFTLTTGEEVITNNLPAWCKQHNLNTAVVRAYLSKGKPVKLPL